MNFCEMLLLNYFTSVVIFHTDEVGTEASLSHTDEKSEDERTLTLHVRKCDYNELRALTLIGGQVLSTSDYTFYGRQSNINALMLTSV